MIWVLANFWFMHDMYFDWHATWFVLMRNMVNWLKRCGIHYKTILSGINYHLYIWLFIMFARLLYNILILRLAWIFFLSLMCPYLICFSYIYRMAKRRKRHTEENRQILEENWTVNAEKETENYRESKRLFKRRSDRYNDRFYCKTRLGRADNG